MHVGDDATPDIPFNDLFSFLYVTSLDSSASSIGWNKGGGIIRGYEDVSQVLLQGY